MKKPLTPLKVVKKKHEVVPHAKNGAIDAIQYPL